MSIKIRKHVVIVLVATGVLFAIVSSIPQNVSYGLSANSENYLTLMNESEEFATSLAEYGILPWSF
jgi:hypothetical protein